jgi:hypothetical protein
MEQIRNTPGGAVSTSIRGLEIAARRCNVADREVLEGAARLIRRQSLDLAAARSEIARLKATTPDHPTAELQARLKAQEEQITRLHWELNATTSQQKRDAERRAQRQEIAQLKDQIAAMKGERKPGKRESTMPKIDPVEPSAEEQIVLDKRSTVKAELEEIIGQRLRGGMTPEQKARVAELNAKMAEFKLILKVFAKERQSRYLAAQAAALREEAQREIAELR